MSLQAVNQFSGKVGDTLFFMKVGGYEALAKTVSILGNATIDQGAALVTKWLYEFKSDTPDISFWIFNSVETDQIKEQIKPIVHAIEAYLVEHQSVFSSVTLVFEDNHCGIDRLQSSIAGCKELSFQSLTFAEAADKTGE